MSEKPIPKQPSDSAGTPANPDWRNGDSYRHLLELDAEGWAWEWLRRNPAYREYARETPVEKTPSGKTVNPIQIGRDGADWGLLFR